MKLLNSMYKQMLIIHSVIGKGAGSLIGGYMMKAFGTRETYRVFSSVCIITGVVYFLFNKFYLRKRPQVIFKSIQ